MSSPNALRKITPVSPSDSLWLPDPNHVAVSTDSAGGTRVTGHVDGRPVRLYFAANGAAYLGDQAVGRRLPPDELTVLRRPLWDAYVFAGSYTGSTMNADPYEHCIHLIDAAICRADCGDSDFEFSSPQPSTRLVCPTPLRPCAQGFGMRPAVERIERVVSPPPLCFEPDTSKFAFSSDDTGRTVVNAEVRGEPLHLAFAANGSVVEMSEVSERTLTRGEITNLLNVFWRLYQWAGTSLPNSSDADPYEKIVRLLEKAAKSR